MATTYLSSDDLGVFRSKCQQSEGMSGAKIEKPEGKYALIKAPVKKRLFLNQRLLQG